jgi:hypothetical protein
VTVDDVEAEHKRFDVEDLNPRNLVDFQNNGVPVAKFFLVGGYELETLALGLPFMAAFLNPGGWGRSFTSALDHYENMAGM